jgi:hypothetical protein
LISVGFVFAAINNCYAQDGLKLEIVPYLWASGIDADVTVGDQTVKADVGFDDLFDAVDIGGSLLAVTQYNRFILWTQLDYLELDSDELDGAPPNARLETDALFLTAALGYQFSTFGNSTLDVLGGVRYLDLENTISVGDIRSRDRGQDIVDGIFMLRPSFVLNDWAKFNLIMSLGAGDSELNYEVQPQFHFQLSDMLVAQVGYRQLYYDIEGDRGEFDGSFHGFVAGLGFVL